MKNYLLDTNAFYNYLMICKGVNLDKIVPNIFICKDKFKSMMFEKNLKICISPITVTEMASRFSEKPEIIKHIMNVIIGAVSVVHKPKGFCIDQNIISDLATMTTPMEKVKELTCKLAQKRYIYESQFISNLLYHIGLAVAFYLLFDEKVCDCLCAKDMNFLFNNPIFPIFQFVKLNEEISKLTIEYMSELKEYGNSGNLNKDKAKKSFNEKVTEVSIRVVNFIEDEINKLLANNNSSLSATDILDLKIVKSIQKEKSHVMKYLVKLFRNKFCGQNISIAEHIVELFVQNMCAKCNNSLYGKYMKVLCDKWFIVGNKLDKNDFFDCVYMMYIENGLIPISFEGKISDFLNKEGVVNVSLNSLLGESL